MTWKFRIVRRLLHLYPSRWRKEYGAELEALLLLQPLSASGIADVVLSAARQRLRLTEPWKICGLILFSWTAFWIVWNSIAPIPAASFALYSLVNQYLWLLICLAAGFWAVVRGENSVWTSASGAVKASLAGIVPDLVLWLLYALRVLPPILVDINGHRHPDRMGIAMLNVRGPETGVLEGVLAGAIVLPVIMAIAAELVGLCGALLGKAVVKARLRSV